MIASTQYLFTKDIKKFIDHLIEFEGEKNSQGNYILHFDDLSPCSQGHLVTLFLERDDKDMFSFYENDQYEQIVAEFIKYLENQDDEKALEFSRSMRNNVIKYYSKQAQDLIDERCSDLRADELYEMGYRRRDSINGELMQC